ncbi:hypothetical protein [Klebsiella quasipneumoniae]|uniref:hypothetical protein n=1 Tax=Klebsiella quasipneumoniae TaxID=1463165 RepID=UPI0021815D60|nr:hypothetical protein [Klebsiella quasipneumoniae]GKQ09131.1 hypothetical protein NUKP79_28520 [Klebsiella quasipneumoniae]HCI8784530.1 hypothetical protein [Klebsiella quasipneumoniae]
MADITELAQREKFEAWLSEKPLHARYVHWCGSLKAYDYASIQLAWQAYQAGGAELVEALEKAQAKNTVGVAGMAESYETTISMLRSRIAELESRTVTVKMPDEVDVLLNHLEDVLPFDAFQLIDVHKWNAVSRLSAAGIKVETE